MQRIIAGEWLAHEGLNQDSLEAFCLNLRFLIQPRDGFSVWQVASLADAWPEEHAAWRDGIRAAVLCLDSALDSRCLVQFIESRQTTNRDLFEVLFYGGIAHANRSKRDQYSKLVKAGLFSFFVFQAFTEILIHYRNCIRAIAVQVTQYLDSRRCQVDGG